MDLIDTHCHLDVVAFDADREDVLAACRANGVNRIGIPGVDAAAWGRILALCASAPGLYPTLGLHPVYLDQHRAELDDVLGAVLIEIARMQTESGIEAGSTRAEVQRSAQG